MSFTEWMKEHASSIEDKPLSTVHLPGTHDSGAYKLDVDITLSDSETENNVKTAARACWGAGERVVTMWTETQELDITGQLDAGIRFFDFRLSPQNASQVSEPTIWISHTVACVPFAEALSQVDGWLSQHPSEVVLLRLTRDWEHRTYWTPEHAAATWQAVKDTVGRWVLPAQARADSKAGGILPTYGEIMAAGRPLVVFWEMETPAGEVGDEVSTACTSGPDLTVCLWPNKANPEENLQGMEEMVKARQAQAGYAPGQGQGGAEGWGRFHKYGYAAFAATPGLESISCLGLFGLKSLADKSAELLPQLLNLDLTGCPCICVDFPSEDVVRAIVGQNRF